MQIFADQVVKSTTFSFLDDALEVSKSLFTKFDSSLCEGYYQEAKAVASILPSTHYRDDYLGIVHKKIADCKFTANHPDQLAFNKECAPGFSLGITMLLGGSSENALKQMGYIDEGHKSCMLTLEVVKFLKENIERESKKLAIREPRGGRI